MGKRVLIVSTYKIRCGVASFTEVVRSQLEDDFHIDVFPLDQYILRAQGRRVNKAGDRLIRDIVVKAKDYDLVNLQWEPGFLGLTERQIIRRFKLLTDGISKIVITAHTVLPAPVPFSLQKMWESYWEGGLDEVKRLWRQSTSRYLRKTYGLIRTAQRSSNVHVIAHTRRDRRFFEKVVGLRNVHDHPLSHISPGWVNLISPAAIQERQRIQDRLGPETKLIGVFGFLSAYKGFDTALQALRLMPDNYHLLIYGGVHHVAIKERSPIDPYVGKLLGIIKGSDESLVSLSNSASRTLRRMDDDLSAEAIKALYVAVKPVDARVHFMGSPNDFDFAVAMKAMDVCLFPYLEVGQSGSGPVSQAIELGKRTITTNNKTFGEVGKYFPEKFHTFDIGNYIQLSQLAVRVAEEHEPSNSGLPYDYKTQREFYRSIFNAF